MKKHKTAKLVLDRSTIRVLVDDRAALVRGGGRRTETQPGAAECNDDDTLKGGQCSRLASGCGASV